MAIVGVRAAQARVCERNVGTLRAIYPVNSIYISASPTNPADLFGFGTWERFGNGRALVGVDEADSNFNTVQQIGGESNIALTQAQMPGHTHSTPNHTHSFTNATGNFIIGSSQWNAIWGGSASGVFSSRPRQSRQSFSGSGWSDQPDGFNFNYNAGDHIQSSGGGTSGNAGSGAAHNNLPPYITVFMWRRSA